MVHRVATSGTTSDNEWQRVTTSGTANYNKWQWTTTSDREWQRVTTSDTASDVKWQWETASDSSGTTTETITVHFKEWMVTIFSMTKTNTLLLQEMDGCN